MTETTMTGTAKEFIFQACKACASGHVKVVPNDPSKGKEIDTFLYAYHINREEDLFFVSTKPQDEGHRINPIRMDPIGPISRDGIHHFEYDCRVDRLDPLEDFPPFEGRVTVTLEFEPDLTEEEFTTHIMSRILAGEDPDADFTIQTDD